MIDRSHATDAGASPLLETLVLLPGILRDANRRCGILATEYDRVIRPLVQSYVRNETEQSTWLVKLLPATVKGAFLLQNYARLVGEQVAPDLALLAGGVTRIYDDLIDNQPEATIFDHISVLFEGGSFRPATDLEALFAATYAELERRLPRHLYPICYEGLLGVHLYQRQSRRQHSTAISTDDLREISARKGAQGTLVLLGMVRSQMSAEERALVEDLGALFQHIDDYQDIHDDRRRGVHTVATRGVSTIRLLSRQIGDLAPKLRSQYGNREARVFLAGLRCWLVMAYGVRAFATAGIRFGAERPALVYRRRRIPMLLLF